MAVPELKSRLYSKAVSTGFVYKIQPVFYTPAINKWDLKLKTQYY